ncbi:MAG TPA: gamma-glutamyltransferase family protein [Jatrophihabitantaceae bacterium]|nr:gamma-glutamyltransferase family protein [Jatrophihabitantaceae bacterium]
MSTTRPELTGTFGMVASTHWLASAAGMSVLEQGGNAFDAACAAGFVLQVVEPHLNGPGGDMPAVVWSTADGAPFVVCGQGVAPSTATIDRFTDLGLDLVPGSGLLAATVPGAFGAWTLLLERWGSWDLDAVLGYALHYAEHGFPVLETTARAINAVAQLFTEHWQPSADVWLSGGTAPRPGTLWKSPTLAATYRRIIAAGTGRSREQRIAAARVAWYQGFIAEAVDDFCRSEWRDSSGRDHAGLLSADDLARWRPSVEAPVRIDLRERFTVCKTDAWGQGPVLLQQLQMLEALGIAEHPPRSSEWIHLVVESAKLAFADREAWYGDSPDIPLATLLSPTYAAHRAHLVTNEASLDLRPGSPDGRAPRLPTLAHAESPALDRAAGTGEPTVGSSGEVRGDTCHVDVVDRWGNLVSATPSGGWLQSSPVIPALGFPLGTRAQMFFLEPGLPNSLRPGARPRTTLSPSLALRDGTPWLAFGTPGGDHQDQWQLPFLLDVLDGAGLQAAIDAPTFHTNHMPSSFYPRASARGEVLIEDRIDEATREELTRRGHHVVAAAPWSLGRLSAVGWDAGIVRAGANARGGQGYAAGR